MNNLISLLPKLIDAAGENPELTEMVAKIAWTRAAGEGLRAQAVPLRFTKQTLTVAVADAIWQSQLGAMKGELLGQINRLLGRNLIKSIEFKIDQDAIAAMKVPATESQRPSGLESLPLDLLSAAATIDDEELRQRFVRAAGNCIERRDHKLTKQI